MQLQQNVGDTDADVARAGDEGAPRTILIVDDHAVARAGIRWVLEQRFGSRFALAEGASLAEGLSYLEAHRRGTLVLLLDLILPDTRGLAGLQLVRQRHPTLPVIVISAIQDARIQDEAGMHGAVAYVCKAGGEASVQLLLESVEAIAASAVAPRGAHRPRPAQQVDARLTQRQVQVLELILSGHDNQAIAHETGLALGSVKNIVSSIFLALDVRSRAELMGVFSN